MSEDAEDREVEPSDDPVPTAEGPADAPGTHVRAMEFWDDVIADMEATAAEYEADGWETLQLHPGDVTALAPDDGTDDRFGIDVLVPNDEFDAVEALVGGPASFDSYEAFTATGDGLVLLVVAVEDADRETAVLYPAYYDAQQAQGMLTAAREAGELHTYVRTLTNERIEFTHADPETFAPPTGEE